MLSCLIPNRDWISDAKPLMPTKTGSSIRVRKSVGSLRSVGVAFFAAFIVLAPLVWEVPPVFTVDQRISHYLSRQPFQWLPLCTFPHAQLHVPHEESLPCLASAVHCHPMALLRRRAKLVGGAWHGGAGQKDGILEQPAHRGSGPGNKFEQSAVAEAKMA